MDYLIESTILMHQWFFEPQQKKVVVKFKTKIWRGECLVQVIINQRRHIQYCFDRYRNYVVNHRNLPPNDYCLFASESKKFILLKQV